MPNTLLDLAPEEILPNDENPRMHFRDDALAQLADSVDESGGVLVPVYVYPDPGEAGRYRLIDGERRWRVAQRLGLETIPALVRDSAPDPKQNIIEMFNIHKVREDWEDMPTARALQQVMERTGKTDLNDLREITGLSREQITRYKLLLDLPAKYQDMVEEGGELTMNFFVELDRNVIKPIAAKRSALAAEFDRDALLDVFVEKRLTNRIPDITDLRKIRPIIDRARADAGSRDAPSELDATLEELFQNADASIDDAYESSVAFGVEVGKLGNLATQIVNQIGRLFGETTDPDDRDALVKVVTETRDHLTALLAEHTD